MNHYILINNLGGTSGYRLRHGSDQILSFDAEEMKWNIVGTMKHERAYHSVSVVDLNTYCI